jgi:hypothetical protein
MASHGPFVFYTMLTVDIRASPAVSKSLPDSVIPHRWDMCYASRRFAARVIHSPPEDTLDAFGIPQALGQQFLGFSHQLTVIPGPANKPKTGGDGEWYGHYPLHVLFSFLPLPLSGISLPSSKANSHRTRSSLGELTDLGRQSTLRLGQMIRALYVNRLGLVPDRLEHKDEDLVAFRSDASFFFHRRTQLIGLTTISPRSTSMFRSYESLKQIVRGIYPLDKLETVPRLVVRDHINEYLYLNLSCAKLRRLSESFKDAAAQAINDSLATLEDTIGHLVGG